MARTSFFFLVGALLLTFMPHAAWSQVEFKTDSPSEYSDYIVSEQEKVGEKFIEFSNLLLTSTDVKANEAKRQEVVRQIELSLRRLRNMAPFKEGAKLRDEAVSVFESYRDLHMNEYARVAVLVAQKDNSLEALEEYFVMQIKVERKMRESADRLRTAQAKFAETYKMALVHNPMQDQFDRILASNIYSREVFLEYIAVAKVNEAWWTAMEKSDAVEMEKQRLALLEAVRASKLGGMGDFRGDTGFRDAAKARADYFATLATSDYKEIAEVLGNAKRTKEDVDFVNGAIDKYNEQNQALNKKFNEAHRDLKLKALPEASGGGR